MARPDGPGSREPSPAVSAASGFDPSRDDGLCPDCGLPWACETCAGDMSWFLIAVTARKGSTGYRDVVILDYSPGWSQFDIQFYWEDTFASDAPGHLEAGAYRYTGFTIGSWGEDDHIQVHGGTFTRDSDGSPQGGDACGSVHDSASRRDRP